MRTNYLKNKKDEIGKDAPQTNEPPLKTETRMLQNKPSVNYVSSYKHD